MNSAVKFVYRPIKMVDGGNVVNQSDYAKKEKHFPKKRFSHSTNHNIKDNIKSALSAELMWDRPK